MTDWTEGYVAEIGYTHGYYAELGTKRVEMALLNAGLCPQKLKPPVSLDSARGLANIHAAASDVVWYGTDFNPSQAMHKHLPLMANPALNYTTTRLRILRTATICRRSTS